MKSSTFKFSVLVSHSIHLPEYFLEAVDRDTFFQWLWSHFGEHGLVGVHEGTLLSEEAPELGLETDSWTVDAGIAPHERDWVGSQDRESIELYFSDWDSAHQASCLLKGMKDLAVSSVEEQVSRDWDAEWKASFLNNGNGVFVAPFWKIVPPWVSFGDSDARSSIQLIKVNPGAGFGTGTHETTQLCLKAIGELHQEFSLKGCSVLDFGSGSGILAIGMAVLGAQVEAVEIDALALDNAVENAGLNQVEKQVSFSQSLPSSHGHYRMIVANILKPVLLEYGKQLVEQLAPSSSLVLSGLIEKDVEEVRRKYEGLLGVPLFRMFEQGEWRALVFKSREYLRMSQNKEII